MEDYDDFTGGEMATALSLEAASVLGGIAIGHKLKEQGVALPIAVAAGAGVTILGVKASTGLVELVSKTVRSLDPRF